MTEYTTTGETVDYAMNEMAHNGWKLVTVTFNPNNGSFKLFWTRTLSPQESRCCC